MDDREFSKEWAAHALLRAMERHAADRVAWEALALWYISGNDYTSSDDSRFSSLRTREEVRDYALLVRRDLIQAMEGATAEHHIQHSLPHEFMVCLMESADAAVRRIALKSGGKPRRSTALPAASAAMPEQRQPRLSEAPVILPRGVRERLREQEARTTIL